MTVISIVLIVEQNENWECLQKIDALMLFVIIEVSNLPSPSSLSLCLQIIPPLHSNNQSINTKMAPITKTKSAFGFFQAQNLGKIKNELKLSMGDAMKELSTRWKALSKIDREPFFQLEAEDRERFQQESALADAEAFADQEKRRDNLVAKDGEGVSMRGERKKIAEEREMVEDDRKRRKARIEADTDPEILAERRRVKQQKKQEALERQKKRDGEEQKLKARHNKLDKDAKKKQAKRLEYLLEQTYMMDCFLPLKTILHSSTFKTLQHALT